MEQHPSRPAPSSLQVPKGHQRRGGPIVVPTGVTTTRITLFRPGAIVGTFAVKWICQAKIPIDSDFYMETFLECSTQRQ